MNRYIALVILVMSSSICLANSIPSAYRSTALKFGIPPKVFYSIALQESGYKLKNQKFRPWPWSLNISGKSYRFQSLKSACSSARKAIASGRSTDIGLMQVHWQSHRNRFKKGFDPCHLLKPKLNLKLAAVIYREQFNITKNVWKAVGRYHSPGNRRLQRKYRSLVAKHYKRLS